MLTLGVNSKPRLSNETFGLLRDIIYAKCGIFFPEAKKYFLEMRLFRRLEEMSLKSFEDYYYFITYDSQRAKELHNLFNSIVTNETSFFRDLPQLDAFRKGVVPNLLDEKAKAGSRTLKLWSAACSTGEEPLTLAMMLLEDGVQIKGWNIDILASDISDNVLRPAAAGVYEKYSLRNTPENYLKKYFQATGKSYATAQIVRDLVRYRKINLMDSIEMRMVRGVDIIFCRNVLIYFDDNSKKKVIA